MPVVGEETRPGTTVMTVAEVAGSRSEHFSMRTFRARPRNLKEPEKLFVGKLLPEATEEPKHARRDLRVWCRTKSAMLFED